MKQTIAAQLDLRHYLEQGSVHLAAGMRTPDETACAQEADEQWRTQSGVVYTFDFDDWSVNLHFDPEKHFSHDTIDFFGDCELPGFADIAGPLQAAHTVEGATNFDLGDEHVVLLPSSVTVHFRKAENDAQVLTKIAGALLTHGAVLDFYQLMLSPRKR